MSNKSTKKLEGKRVDGILYLECVEPEFSEPLLKKSKGYWRALKNKQKKQ